MKKILVINGPNINMLGIREPELYGELSYDKLISLIEDRASKLGVAVSCFQSNYEGAIIDKLQQAYNTFDAIIINPAAYTHTSIAIHDALKAIGLPAAEVHITDIDNREEFRKISYVGLACRKRFIGLGVDGYLKALEYLAEL